MFMHGEKVNIIEGSFAGFNATVIDPLYTPGQCQIEVSNSVETDVMVVPNEFLVPASYGIQNKVPVETFQIDISKYLTEDQMKDISTRIYEERITKFVDEVLERRTPPYGGIVDQILMATIERYVTKLSDKFEVDFLAKAKECVELKNPGNDEHTTFQEQLTFKLANAADKYIDANLSEIHNIMSSTIQDAATKLQISDISRRIAKKIDLTKIIAEIMLEESSI